MADLRLVAAASSFALTSTLGAAVSARHDIPGEPLGLRVPTPVRVQLLTGLGSGLSAPLPMPLAARGAAGAADGRETWPSRLCAGIGGAALVGMLVEPVTWGRRSEARSVKATVAVNVVSAAALLLAGRRTLPRSARRADPS